MVMSVRQENVRTIDDTFDLADRGFRLAFGVSGADNDIPLEDPNFVEWTPYFVHVVGDEDDLRTEYIPIPFHKCNDEDWTHFHEPKANSVHMIDKYKKHNFFYCLDEFD